MATQLPFTGGMNDNIFTTNADIRTSEVTQSSHGSNTRRVNDITVVVQNMHVNSNWPNSQTRRDTQRLRVNAARFPQTVFQQAL